MPLHLLALRSAMKTNLGTETTVQTPGPKPYLDFSCCKNALQCNVQKKLIRRQKICGR